MKKLFYTALLASIAVVNLVENPVFAGTLIQNKLSNENDVDFINFEIQQGEVGRKSSFPSNEYEPPKTNPLTKAPFQAITYSYGGGTSRDGTSIPRGGFDPILGLYSSSSEPLKVNDDTRSPLTRPDPTTGSQFDSSIETTLAAGKYRLSVSQYDNFPPSFTGKSFNEPEDPPFVDVTGSRRSSNYSLDLLTPEKILRKSVTVKKSGKQINAEFKPLGGKISLADAADFLGVDHFNWLQTVEFVPASWNPQVFLGTTIDASNNLIPTSTKSVRTPFLDPLIKNDSFLLFNDFSGNFGGIWTHPSPLDNLPYYLNDSGAGGTVGRSDEVGMFSNTNILKFTDAPSQPDNVFRKSDRLTFKTKLVGVKSDNTYIEWNGLGTNFTWSSNTRHRKGDANRTIISGGIVGGIGYSYVTEPEILPPTLSGGVFDIKLDIPKTVPEPTSLLGIGLTLSGFVFCRRNCNRTSRSN